ncbi:MAG: hypothetical protein U1E33_01400 [Rhodospirillales bacterium]
MKRGNVTIALQLDWTAGRQACGLTRRFWSSFSGREDLEARLPQHRLCSADGLLALRGVVEVMDPMPTGEARAALEAAARWPRYCDSHAGEFAAPRASA